LLRRRFSVERPERVRMRARNPWVRARLRFFGWYVRFIVSFADHAVESCWAVCTRSTGTRRVQTKQAFGGDQV